MSDYLDKIAAGYVRQLSKVNRLEDETRREYVKFYRTSIPTPEYKSIINAREHARKILDRWYKVFNSASKRIATGK